MSYTPLHPEIFTYDPRFIGPALRNGVEGATHEDVEQIYRFSLFTPEFCRLLIEEAEHCGQWTTGQDVDPNPYAEGVEEVSEPDTTLHLWKMPGMDKVYEEIIHRHLKPLAEHLWPIFKVQKWDPPFLLRYEPHVISGMARHYDLETCAIVCYLNDDFTGGGTYFPRWDYTPGLATPGTAVIYPGGLSHVHEGRPVTSGRRYVLCSCFF